MEEDRGIGKSCPNKQCRQRLFKGILFVGSTFEGQIICPHCKRKLAVVISMKQIITITEILVLIGVASLSYFYFHPNIQNEAIDSGPYYLMQK